MRRLLLAWILIFMAVPAPAQTLTFSEGLPFYKHTAFPTARGAPGGVTALAQTPDGMIWIGTIHGLYRFDGATFDRVPFRKSLPPRCDCIQSLLVDRNGALWIGHMWGGVETLKDGQFVDRNQGHYFTWIAAVVQAGDGAVWVLGDGLRFIDLQRYRNYRREDARPYLRLPRPHGSRILPARDGSIWVGLEDKVARLAPGSRAFTISKTSYAYDTAIATAPDGRLLSIGPEGLRYAIFEGRSATPPIGRFPKAVGQFATAPGAQRDLWIAGPASGLYRIEFGDRAGTWRASRVDADKLTSPLTTALLVDREGSVWVGTQRGLDQFAPALFNRVLSLSGGPGGSNALFDGAELIHGSGGSFIAKLGHAYFRPTADGGLEPIAGLGNIASRPCLDENASIWVIGGKTIGRLDGGKRYALPSYRGDQTELRCIVTDGGRRIHFIDGNGLYRLDGANWRRIRLMPELPADEPASEALRGGDDFFASLANVALFRITRGRPIKVSDPAQNFFAHMNAMLPDPGGDLIGGTFGLARYMGGRVQILSRDQYPFLDEISGIARGPSDIVWIMSTAGLMRLDGRELRAAFDQPGSRLNPTIFGSGDGFDAVVVANNHNNLATDAAGHVWLAADDGIYMFDANRLRTKGRAPPVTISSIDVDGKAISSGVDIVLPSDPTDVHIRFMVGSLRSPINNQSRYRLVGLGSNWIDPGSAKEAIYTHLAPGDYTFQVIAADASGNWNRTGASLKFRVPPTFVQSWWFTALCCLAIVIIAVGLYQARLGQLAANLRSKFEARSAERERIARELHDTLLQGVQALIIGMQNVADDLPSSAPERARMNVELDRADRLLAEGRDRVHDLRTADAEPLETALAALDRWDTERKQPKVQISVSGAPRNVIPDVSVELVRIVEEALTNVYQHAQAVNVLIAVEYGVRALAVRVEDDGVGGVTEAAMDRKRSAGRFGIIGMRERAARIGASWSIADGAVSGTVMNVRVPARLAYVDARRGIGAKLRGALAAVWQR